VQKLTLSIPHRLTRAEVKRRIDEEVGRAEKQFGQLLGAVERRWTGDTLDFKVTVTGQSVSGQAFVEDQAVRLEVELPLMLSLLAGGVRETLEERGRELLGHRAT
jgi:hypothetical protein